MPWHTLSGDMQDSISQLCEAIGRGRIGEAYILHYMEHMAMATEQSPPAPNLSALNFGALAYIP